MMGSSVPFGECGKRVRPEFLSRSKKAISCVVRSNETRPRLHRFSIVRADAGHALQQRLPSIFSGAHGLGRRNDAFKFLCRPG